MKCHPARLLVLAGVSALSCLPVGDPSSSCTADFSSCTVYENQLLALPGLAISGDVILLAPDLSTAGVFRIFNDFFDTGGGTGLGGTVFLFSAFVGNLPNPSTYSVNAVTIPVGPLVNGFFVTDYNSGSGTDYVLNLAAQRAGSRQPSDLLGIGTLLIGVARRKRKAV